MQITAAIARGSEEGFRLETLTLAEPQDDEVQVKIVAVGVCHTDIAARNQTLPISLPAVLGHEGAGVVEKVGRNVTKVAIGDHVVLSFSECARCVNCRRGEVAYCEEFGRLNCGGRRHDGTATLTDGQGPISGHFFGQSSFATHALANERNAIKIPRHVPLEIMGPLGCGIQTGAGSVMRSLRAQAGRAIAIFGGGSVGLSAVMGAVIQGCTPIIVIEPVQARRELALELGATLAIDPGRGPVARAIRSVVPRGVDYAVDTTGVVPVLESALSSLCIHGQLAMVGVPHEAQTVWPLSVLGFLSSGVTVKCVYEGDSCPEEYIPELIALYEAGRLPLQKLVKTYPFSEINTAIADQIDGRCVKAVLTIGQP